MLILSRKPNESFLIEGTDGPIEIVVTEISAGQVRIGIRAPKNCKILRQELAQTMEYNRQAAGSLSSHSRDIVAHLKKD